MLAMKAALPEMYVQSTTGLITLNTKTSKLQSDNKQTFRTQHNKNKNTDRRDSIIVLMQVDKNDQIEKGKAAKMVFAFRG